MTGVSRTAIESALDQERRKLPAGTKIGPIFLVRTGARVNWSAVVGASGSASLQPGHEAIERVHARYPRVRLSDFYAGAD